MALNISKFLDQFYMEGKEKLSDIQTNMVELENNPRNKDAILAIQRDMHTIKGSGRMVGLKEISEIAHLMEEAFILIHGDRLEVIPPLMTILYRGVDGVAELLRLSENKKPLADAAADIPKVLEDIRRAIRGETPTAPAAAPEKIQIDEPSAPAAPKRKFKLDFTLLKEKIKGKAPETEKEEEKKTAIPGAPEAPEALEVPVTPVTPVTPARVMEKTHLKIDNDRFDTVVNQVTDLLVKRYFFNRVVENCSELSQLTRGLQKEWKTLKNVDIAGGSAVSPGSEAAANIDATLDLFLKKIQEFGREYQVNLVNFEGALRDVYDSLLDLKLTPLSGIFNIYPRFVRDYAYRTGKKIRVYIRGGGTQLDKTVIEKINEPLIHLVRNACDHGIELPEAREKKDKSATGTIIIEANKKGGRVEIKVSDDGCGLDKDRILKKAGQKDLVNPDTAGQLEEQEIFDFIFQAGFSTASEVTDTSGRGLGMDIVRKVTRRFGGSVTVESRKDHGTTFRLEFPISIFTNQVTYIKDEGRVYGIPCNLIRRIVKLHPGAGDIKEKTDYSVVVFDGEIYTVAKLNQVLTGSSAGIGSAPVFMVLPRITEKKIGIIVDEILHEAEVIIKDPGRFLGKRKYVYGLVIGEKGELQTVLDVHDVALSDEFSRKIKILTPAASGRREKPCILAVDDSLLVREMQRHLLESAGYTVVTAINGLDGYNKALSRRFDLVLADIEMPEMDGFEMIENIKKIAEYADVPTIVLSSVEKEEDKIRGIKLGVNAWLQKQDFEEKEVLKVIKRFIG
ncbi:MAG: hybrid sensor histidine kinase/response regulator [bacterium]|nr:hybrid sensor histidine kinase/response regulator [bacterium]